MKKFLSLEADWWGILSSGLCLVHCLLPPLLLLFHWQHAEALHIPEGIEYVFLLVSLWAVVHALRQHRNRFLQVFLCVAFVLLSVGILLEARGAFFQYLSYAGSLLLIGGHIANIRYCRQCKGG